MNPRRPAKHGAGSPTNGEPVTAAPIPQAQAGLRRLQERTKHSKTDLANRAISFYEFVDAQLRAGHELIVKDNRTGKTQLVQLLGNPLGEASAAPAVGPLPEPMPDSLSSDFDRTRRAAMAPGVREAMRPARPAARVAGTAAGLLARQDRARYREEYQSELAELAASGSGRWRQLGLACGCWLALSR